jgi:DNA-binding CsgD family transcriptional regulator
MTIPLAYQPDGRATLASALRRLTSRERQILDAMLAPQTAKETARSLKLSPGTVRVHRGRVLAKMGVGSAVELMRLFLDEREGHSAGGGEAAPLSSVRATRDRAEALVNAVTYSPTIEPGAVTVCMMWGAGRRPEALVIPPESLAVAPGGASRHQTLQRSLEEAIGYGLQLALQAHTRLVISGDPTVWDEGWGVLPGAGSRTPGSAVARTVPNAGGRDG